MAGATQRVVVWVSEPLELDLLRLANADGRKLSDYCRWILACHVYGHRATLVDVGEDANSAVAHKADGGA